MKKLLSIILAFIMLLSLSATACKIRFIGVRISLEPV